MPKYSIIIPVYNAAPYLARCLNSVLNQQFDDYEVIIINDGSTDNSKEIIKKYVNKKLIYYEKENGGVSDARNFGIKKVSGKFFLFVDADDYVSEKLLKVIDENIDEDIDILSFNIAIYNKSNKLLSKTAKPILNKVNGEKAILSFINKKELFDTPVAYIYKTSYFVNYQFTYAKGRIFEDFGLTPLILIKAKTVKSISDCLYNYVLNDKGIIKDNSLEARIKKAWDMLYHFDYLFLNINNDITINDWTKKVFNSFIANAVIMKASLLEGIYLKRYIDELKSRHLSKFLSNKSLKSRLKKLLFILNINLYLKLFAKGRNKDG